MKEIPGAGVRITEAPDEAEGEPKRRLSSLERAQPHQRRLALVASGNEKGHRRAAVAFPSVSASVLGVRSC